MNRLVFVEPGLAAEAGHPQAHARALAAECSRRGWVFEFLTNAGVGETFLGDLPATAAFRVNVYAQPRFRHPLFVLEAWRSWSRRYHMDFATAGDALCLSGKDILILNSVRIAVLDGYARWLASRPVDARPATVIMLRMAVEDGLPGAALPAASRWLYRRILGKLQALLALRLRLGADTRLIAEDFERLTGLPVADIPFPVEIPAPLPPRESSASTHLVFPTSGRGRGFHLLPDALAPALARYPGLAATVRVPYQKRKFNAPYIARLAGMAPRVRLIEGDLGEPEFYQLLSDADAVLLPYDPGVFAKRSSQILVQSAALGRPVIVTRGSFLDYECRTTGIVGVTAEALTAEALADAIQRFVEDRERLVAAAWAACPEQRRRHTAAAFMDRLIEFAERGKAPAGGTGTAHGVVNSSG